MTIRYPAVNAENLSERLDQVVSYLRQLADELNLEADSTAQALVRVETRAAQRKNDPADDFQAIKALIIKSADIVEAYSKKITASLEGKYVAVSDFGTYSQQTQARLEAADSALATTVSQVESLSGETRQQLTQLRQTAGELTLRVDSLGQGVRTSTGFTFNDEGLTISRADTQMENRLDETGMHILRGGEELLTADSGGVRAVDVTVENYLQVGRNARFEDYGNGRTACFCTG